jgi:TPR repeat protein
LPVAPEPIEPLPVVASAKPKLSPQAAQLKQGEAALKRREFEKALAILEPLARESNTQAQVWLAAIYENGHGVSQDLVLSYIWYSLAARGGDAAGATGRDRLSARLQPSQIRQADTVIESRQKK